MELDIRDITITPRATAIPVTVIPRSRATRDALTRYSTTGWEDSSLRSE